MVNFSKTLMRVAMMATVMCGLASCTEQEEELVVEDTGMKTCGLRFNVSCEAFDTPATRTASSTTWANDDKVYLTFGGNAYGVATFQSGDWSVDYYGNLTEGVTDICKAVFFENPASREGFQAVDLTHETAIYEDTLATCLYDGSLLTITANLQPKTGRLRFRGDANDTIHVYGLTTSKRYSVFKGEYTDTVCFMQLAVDTSGYTPYIYGEFVDTTDRRLNVATLRSAYTRVFNDSVMNQGQSGWMSIPTASAHAAWREKMIFKVGNTEFAMMPVTEGGYLSFLIGETEITEGLYNAVVDPMAEESNAPKCFETYDDCEAFIYNSLRGNLGVDFSLPTLFQWSWAYFGGDKSQGYTYSGSNDPNEVGWNENNSLGYAHNVALLMPNELGIYDMYGNVSEWCLVSYYSDGSSYCPYVSSFYNNLTVNFYSNCGYSNMEAYGVGARLKLSF